MNNGDYKLIAISVTLVISIAGFAFWSGAESEEIQELRSEMNLLTQVNQRLALQEDQLARMEQHLVSIDIKIEQIQEHKR